MYVKNKGHNYNISYAAKYVVVVQGKVGAGVMEGHRNMRNFADASQVA